LIDWELERLALRLRLVLEAAPDHELIDAAAAALKVLRWPSATWPYLSRHAGTPFMRELWELPAGLDPRPPGLDDDARASVREANAVLDSELAALAERRRRRARCC
jgi:hypothetical protein